MTKGEIAERYFATFFMLASCITAAALQFAALLNLIISNSVRLTAMGIGSAMWIIFAVVCWSPPKTPIKWRFIFGIPSTLIAVASVAGIFAPTFTNFALWANAVLWTLMIVLLCVSFRDLLRQCRQPSEES